MPPHEGPDDARAAAARAARASYGRLVALLAAPTRDIPLAEDAVADAFERALTVWAAQGVPANPEGWLLTVARNRQRDILGSAAHRTSAVLQEEASVMAVLDDLDLDRIPDKRLELLFVCAHPAIDAAVRTPLMLQVVLGIGAAEIARAFAVPAAVMAQRLVRAKRRIRHAGIPFAVPTRADMPGRLAAVLEAVYGAYAVGWRADADLSGEALYLAVTLAELLGDEPEAYGLAALIALSAARASVVGNEFVPLDEQDPAGWDAALIVRGEQMLQTAYAFHRPGRFQLEAAIQSAVTARASGEAVAPAVLERLHVALVAVAPTLGARIALAAAIGDARGPVAGLAALDAIGGAGEGFGPYWATRAHLLAAEGRRVEATAAYDRAITLVEGASEQRWLAARRDAQR